MYIPVKMMVGNRSGPRSSKEFTNLFAETSSGLRCLDLVLDAGSFRFRLTYAPKRRKTP